MGPPVPPDSAVRDEERVNVLLEINSILLQDAVKLQADGKGCDLGQPSKDSMDYLQ
jgi:hypothetical protein